MRRLTLVLKAIWYRMIQCGIKKEEYREITPYWVNRLLQERVHVPFEEDQYKRLHLKPGERIIVENLKQLIACGNLSYIYKPGDEVEFAHGYGKDRPTMLRIIESITIGKGNPDWGAKKDKEYFIIRFREK